VLGGRRHHAEGRRQLLFAAHQREPEPQPRPRVGGGEQPLSLAEVETHCRAHGIRELVGVARPLGLVGAEGGGVVVECAAQPLGEVVDLLGVAGPLLEEGHLAREVCRARAGHEPVQPEAPHPGGHDEVAPVADRGRLHHAGHAPDLVQVADRVGTDLMALSDRDDPELGHLHRGEQVAEQLDVARLEELQRQHRTGHQDGAEREQREPGHALTLGGCRSAQQPGAGQPTCLGPAARSSAHHPDGLVSH
jgi:hypothetical protein